MSITTPSVLQSTGTIARLNDFLDKYVLPIPILILTNRVVILLTLSMLVPLVVLANNTVFVLLANSYLNVMSVVVSSTVLLYATLSEVREREAAQRREEIAKAHEEAVDRRAQTDHELIQTIHSHIDEIRVELTEHVNESLDNIEKILIQRLETIQDEDHQHIEEMHKAVLQSAQAHREELADLREMMEVLHKGLTGTAGAPNSDSNIGKAK